MVTLQGGGLETAGHDLPHDEHIQLLIRHLGHCTSNGEEVVCWKEPATRGLFEANITTTAMLYEGLHHVFLLGIYIPQGHRDVADVGQCSTLKTEGNYLFGSWGGVRFYTVLWLIRLMQILHTCSS